MLCFFLRLLTDQGYSSGVDIFFQLWGFWFLQLTTDVTRTLKWYLLLFTYVLFYFCIVLSKAKQHPVRGSQFFQAHAFSVAGSPLWLGRRCGGLGVGRLARSKASTRADREGYLPGRSLLPRMHFQCRALFSCGRTGSHVVVQRCCI